MHVRMWLGIVLLLASTACTPLVKHRDFVPLKNAVTVNRPGELHYKGTHHVVPPEAVDERSAVLVYTTGGDVIDRRDSYRTGRRSAEIKIRFSARNDEPKPLIIEPHNVLMVIDSGRTKPLVLRPTWVAMDGAASESSEIIVAPESIASWEMSFELPEGKNPLRTVRSFLVSWTYRFNGQAFEERSRFVVARRLSNGALVSAKYLLTR